MKRDHKGKESKLQISNFLKQEKTVKLLDTAVASTAWMTGQFKVDSPSSYYYTKALTRNDGTLKLEPSTSRTPETRNNIPHSSSPETQRRCSKLMHPIRDELEGHQQHD